MDKRVDIAKIKRIELGLLANRPALEAVCDGEWVWRYGKGYTGRANSVQCHDIEDKGNYIARLTQHWARSKAYGISPQFRVTVLTPPVIVSYLLEQNFVRHSNTKVMNLSGAKSVEPVSGKGTISEHSVMDKCWQKDILHLENIGGEDAKSFVQMLGQLPVTSVGLRLVDERGTLIGAAYASCVEGIGSIFALIVDPAQRGEGHGRGLMVHLLNWLVDKGAQDIALQVVAENRVAIRLYRSFGFEEIYSYYYLVGT